MRAEFAYAPNLTIVDTPGFILKARGAGTWEGLLGFDNPDACRPPWLVGSICHACSNRPPACSPECPALLPLPLQARKGEADTTPDDIMAMVKAQCA